MKKVFAIVALVAALFVSGRVQAQSNIFVGYAPETFTVGNNITNYQGFFVGFSQNVGIYKDFGVAAGANFRMNMKSTTESNSLYSIKTRESQYLIDVPVLFNYAFHINRGISITPFVGPMASLALAGQTKTTTHENLLNTDTENTWDWYGDNSNLSRFNLYAVFGADVKFANFMLYGGYRLGLLDLNKSDNTTLKTAGLFVGLGLSF